MYKHESKPVNSEGIAHFYGMECYYKSRSRWAYGFLIIKKGRIPSAEKPSKSSCFKGQIGRNLKRRNHMTCFKLNIKQNIPKIKVPQKKHIKLKWFNGNQIFPAMQVGEKHITEDAMPHIPNCFKNWRSLQLVPCCKW